MISINLPISIWTCFDSSEDVSDLFICFCEVAQPETPDKDGWVIQKFPDSYNEQGILATIPKFVYPSEFEK